MHKYIIMALMTFSIVEVNAQKFEPAWKQILSDTSVYSQVNLIDFDNDSLLDVVVTGKDQAEMIFFSIFRNIEADSLHAESVISTYSKTGNFVFEDVNSDNFIDIVFTDTTATRMYLNEGDFTFTTTLALSEGGTLVRMADLNQDGGPELIVSGFDSTSFVHIYQKIVGVWELLPDSIQIDASAIEIIDFDKDGLNDLFVSGTDTLGAPVTQLYRNDHNFLFTPIGSLLPVRGISSVSDLNHDGNLDFFLSGTDADSRSRTMALFTSKGGMVARDSFPEIFNHFIFTGDLNSDGRCDLNMLGVTAASDSVNLILHSNGDYDTLDFSGIRHQAFGDLDRDGDLDLIQLYVKDSAELRIFTDTIAVRNHSPGQPVFPIGVRIYDRIFLTWTVPDDDHTPAASLTYDVTIQEEGEEIMSGTFDQLNEKRLAVRHGNTGTVDYVLLRSDNTRSFNYFIEAVDNAYHAGREGGGGGICTGTRMECDDFEIQEIDLCRHELVTLYAPPDARWFSFRDGFLASGPTLTFSSVSDTVFSVARQPEGCPLVTIYKVNIVVNRTVTETNFLRVCDSSQVTLSVESGWEQVLWSSKKKGILSSEQTILFPVTEADTVSVELTDESCIIQRNTIIQISKPVLELEEEAYQVLRGESVRLNAAGGETYLWSPATGLDNPAIANPLASPWQTTEYLVTIGDSLGCTETGKVLVIVEETAFIPNLFTPNDDGKNDELKAYGLAAAGNFSFSIYNREGSLMYTTENPSELGASGWNGMVRGIKQPAGVYYWKVKGENNSGKSILLNGKTTGSILLIR